MMAETRCPYCGASEDANGPRLTFECGTGGNCEGSVIRAAPCYLRQLASANAKIAKLKQESHDADLLLGDTWRDVISTMHGNGGSVESALRQQLHNLSANLRIANAKIAEIQQAAAWSGISWQQVHAIVTRKVWRHVE